ncbi:uncharacterized protein LTR77_010215 [Saxophila tyrrhenica]|uniref:Enoyl reductase (ER) domain-containing protein n=1 Tax=Saxophila tyrrhenica TaxID=1690608 RepID=A0AAV9NW62_9PEZI|nr:hypothetical protein LTR77_010215 [Saxophila tyrrhenica]
MAQPSSRKAYRRTDDYTPGTPKVKLVSEEIPSPLPPYAVLIKVHAVSLNYRDANIANGGNPWPVTPNGILCNDAAGGVISVGERVTRFSQGDRVAPIVDTANITGRETRRSWLAADEDGVLADYIVFDEDKVTKLPQHLDWIEASIIPCAGVTAWSALEGCGMGSTGGVSMFALKLARASGMRVILSSSSDSKLESMRTKFADPPLFTVNYKNAMWHEEVLNLTNGAGVDLVLENGGTGSVVQSVKCTRRGGTVSQVGYLGKQDPTEMAELLPTLIDRRVNLRGINAGSRHDQEDLCAAISAMGMRFDDIIDSTFPFDEAEEAVESIWQGKQVGKVVVKIGG